MISYQHLLARKSQLVDLRFSFFHLGHICAFSLFLIFHSPLFVLYLLNIVKSVDSFSSLVFLAEKIPLTRTHVLLLFSCFAHLSKTKHQQQNCNERQCTSYCITSVRNASIAQFP